MTKLEAATFNDHEKPIAVDGARAMSEAASGGPPIWHSPNEADNKPMMAEGA